MAFPWAQLPFAEAIAFFRNKRNVDTDSWKDLLDIDQKAVFAVAGAKGDLLNDLRTAVDKAIAEGTTITEFRKDFDRIVAARGWSYKGDRDWRTNIIYTTNIRTSYAAGRWEQIQATKAKRPYLQWRHGGSLDPRPLHIALDRKVFAVDDPFWDAIGNPPCGYGCRCSVFSLSDRDLTRLNLKVEIGPKIGTTYGGAIVQPEPGWAGHGRSTPESRDKILARTLKRLHPTIAQQVQAEVVKLAGQPPLPSPPSAPQV